MRPIKFRIWTDEGFIVEPVFIGELYSLIIRGDGLVPLGKCIKQQFTGFKDMNNKEIYEGDILRAKKGEQEKPETLITIESTVVWKRGGLYVFDRPIGDFYSEDEDKIKSLNWCDRTFYRNHTIYYQIKDIEVIGNICENA